MNPLDRQVGPFTVSCNGVLLLKRLDLAETFGSRLRGLLGRDQLPQDEGLYLAPCRAVHTFGMRFALDLLFVDRQWRVQRVVRHVGAGRMAWGGWQAHGVIEMTAGTLKG
ncbi:MAG: DUF192 domain-containing protein [Verrucomicrobia bacterium]|nr:DUF192 domain-containing protein [Verrucomicrobiota bacterium]